MPSDVRKAVIPAAGWGTRFLPVTKAVPKEALPLIDRPVLQFAVEEAAAAGITDVVLVTSANKKALEDYFDRAFELEHFLQGKGDEPRLKQVRSLSDLANIVTVRQPEQLGLGHAVLTAKPAVGKQPFAVILPDDVIEADRPAIRQLMDVYEQRGASVLAVHRVMPAEVSRYGIIDGDEVQDRTYRLRGMVEKPSVEAAPSDLAIIGRYILTDGIFERLEGVRPGAIGEVQLTDAIDALLSGEDVYAHEYEGTLHDGGTPLGLLKASVRVALRRPDIAEDFREWLGDLARREEL